MKKGKLIEYLKPKRNYVYKIYKINVFVKTYQMQRQFFSPEYLVKMLV